MKSFINGNGSRDLIIIILFVVLGTLLLAWLDAFEFFFQFTRKYEDLDEIILGIFLLVIGISWFSYRRWSESVRSIHQIGSMKEELEKSNEELDYRVKNRTRDLEEAQHRLIDQAHKAGMADVAANTLHNVGNLLNNIKTSAQLIEEAVEMFPIAELKSASMILEDKKDNFQDFMLNDPKGKMLFEYYLTLGHELTDRRIEVLTNFVRLNEKIDAIVDVISNQYSFSDMNQALEKLDLQGIIEDALSIASESISEHNIKIKTVFNPVPKIRVNKTKLVSILINLIRNAQDALKDKPYHEKEVNIVLKLIDQVVYIEFWDNGKGISDERLEKIFAFGYTTKKDGHGFGLHSCANYMTEMGHRIWAENDKESGTKFIMRFGNY